MNPPTPLQCNARFDRSLINTKGQSVRYLVVTAQAPTVDPPPDHRRVPLNLSIVIDASGSMEGAPLEAAKQAAIRVINQLKPLDELSCVSFSSDVQVHLESLFMDPDGKRRACDLIKHLASRNSTNLAAGWFEGCRCAASAMERRGGCLNRVLLLSDGHANDGECDPEVLAHHAGELRQRGVLTSTVGIGINYSPVQLQALAEHGGGRMHDAERPEEIAEIVMAELELATGSVADDVYVDVTRPAGVSIEAFGMFPCQQVADRYRCRIGSLSSGQGRTVVFKVTTPAGTYGQTVGLNVSLGWKLPGAMDERRTKPVSCELRFANTDECLFQTRDVTLALEVARIWQAAMVRHAMALNRDGREWEARNYAMAQMKYFRQYCAGVPGTESLVREVERMPSYVGTARDLMPAEPVKEIMLGAYKAVRGEEDRRSRKRDAWASYMKK